MKNRIPFKVLRWDFNKKQVEYWDIIPYFIKEYKSLSKKERDKIKSMDEFILTKAHKFWSKCECEINVSGQPLFPNEEVKIDIYDQIKENIEAITFIFVANL